jgi:hypothetical protein
MNKLNNQQKLLINNVITLILILSTFMFLYNYANKINFEYTYREYKMTDYNIELLNIGNDTDFVITNNEDLRPNNIYIFLLGLALISILNSWYYINKGYHNEQSS